MSSSLENAALRAAIVAKLKTVSGIGLVYDYERYAKTDKDFLKLYGGDSKLLGWHIRRTARRESQRDNEVYTTWEIRGFRSLADADESEKELDGLVDSILDAFRADVRLGNLLLTPKEDDQAVPELLDSGPVMFCGALCNSVRLRYTTRSWREPYAGN